MRDLVLCCSAIDKRDWCRDGRFYACSRRKCLSSNTAEELQDVSSQFPIARGRRWQLAVPADYGFTGSSELKLPRRKQHHGIVLREQCGYHSNKPSDGTNDSPISSALHLMPRGLQTRSSRTTLCRKSLADGCPHAEEVCVSACGAGDGREAASAVPAED